LGGTVFGGLLTLVTCAPAAWLAGAVDNATQGRLQLAQAQGTIWQGSALPVLSAGAGMRDAMTLPSRLHWAVSPSWTGLRLRLRQDCCLNGNLQVDWRMGWREQGLAVQPEAGEVLGHWPAAWLEGLGAPLNTLRPGGELQLSSRALTLTRSSTGWQMGGQAQLDLLQTSSRLSVVEPLGTYRLTLNGAPGAGPVQLNLVTLDGALRLSGHGQIDTQGLHLQGDAQAAPGFEAPLNNLLNIIGRREGALSRISIG
jgi:general secretion pathway protein N